MARHQIEIQIDFSRFGSQRRHIQDIAVVSKKLNRTLVARHLKSTAETRSREERVIVGFSSDLGRLDRRNGMVGRFLSHQNQGPSQQN